MKKDAVIILSGGMDSVTMLYDYQERIAVAISFDYGSNHNAKEIPFAQLHCRRLGIEHLVIPLEFIHRYFDSSLLQGAVVPFRNAIMLSVAVGLAESRHLNYVMMANHGGDHTIYPDCRPEFVKAFSDASVAGTYEKVEVWAPYTMLTKVDIAKRGKELGIDYSETWSCYKGGDVHCGRCGTCMERKEALEQAGIADNTAYEHQE